MLIRPFKSMVVWIQIYLLQMKRNPYLDSEDYCDGINWNPSYHYDEEEMCFAHPGAQNSEGDSEKKRPSHKNKYIKKITMIKPQETTSTKKRQFNPSDFGLEPEQFKKMKNREAAKSSRQRKKLFINLLEEQTKNLQKQIQHTNREIESCKMDIQKNTFNSNQTIGAFDTRMIHAFKKIERLLTTEESEEKNNQINLAIDSLIYRFGATGKERKNNINQSYRQILAETPSIVHRYFMWATKEKAHIFAVNQDDKHSQWFQEIKNILEPNLTNNTSFFQEKRETLAEKQATISRLMTALKETKNQINKFLSVLDNQFMEIRDVLTPTQCAKLVVYIQKLKYRQQLRFIENQTDFDTQHSSPKKRLKREQSSEK